MTEWLVLFSSSPTTSRFSPLQSSPNPENSTLEATDLPGDNFHTSVLSQPYLEHSTRISTRLKPQAISSSFTFFSRAVTYRSLFWLGKNRKKRKRRKKKNVPEIRL